MKLLKNESRIECIIQVVCEKYGVTFDELQSESRLGKIAQPRTIALTLAYSFTNNTKTAIASIFNRDHATLIHSMKKFCGYYDTDKNFRSNIDHVIMEINMRLATNFAYKNIKDANDGYRFFDDNSVDNYQLFLTRARELMDAENPELIMMIVKEMKELYPKI